MTHSTRRGTGTLRSLVAGSLLGLVAAGASPAAVSTTGCAAAASCTFQELLLGGEIEAGGQRFSDFEVQNAPAGFDWTFVVVVGLDAIGSSPGPGLRIEHNGAAAIQDTDCLDLEWSYRVTPAIPSWQPSGNVLEMLTATTVGSARIEVDEALFDQSLRAVGEKTVQSDPSFDESRAIDAIEFAPRTGLVVSNSIVIEGEAAGDQAALHEFVQRFAFTPVPEPADAPMLAGGAALLAALAGRRRRGPPRPPRRTFVAVEFRRRSRTIPVCVGEPNR